MRPSAVTPPITPATTVDIPSTEALVLSEFDKHRKTLLSNDADEGWASELRRYLGTMQHDVMKDTDIVQWWQVCNFGTRFFVAY